MKISALLSLAFACTVSASTYGQNYKLSMNKQDCSISEVLKEIEKNSEYTFFLNDNQVNVNRKTSVKANNASLEEVLEQALKNTGYQYEIVANSYNPNIMAPPEMRLLELSIWEDGYTMPCVCYYLEEDDLYEIVDGYHRYLVMKQSQRIYDREKGMLPVTVIEKDISNRMASTIRHNRARGMHNLELMTEIVTELVKSGMSDKWIMRNIGMDKNELLRFKQISGLAELFRDKEFGWSDDWSEED